MAIYETTFIARQDISTQEVEKITDDVENLLKENNGKILKKEYWGLRILAYKINRNKKGHYIFLVIDTDGETLKKIQRKFKLSEDIIRNLSVKVDEVSKDPSPIMNSKKTFVKRNNQN